jgi:hypothetical protein
VDEYRRGAVLYDYPDKRSKEISQVKISVKTKRRPRIENWQPDRG